MLPQAVSAASANAAQRMIDISFFILSSPSIHPIDLLLICKRVAYERAAVEVFAVHVNGGDAAVVIGGVIIDALVRVAAA